MQIRITFADLLFKLFDWEYITSYINKHFTTGADFLYFLSFLSNRLAHLHIRLDGMLNSASGNRGLTARGLTIPLIVATASYIYFFKWKSTLDGISFLFSNSATTAANKHDNNNNNNNNGYSSSNGDSCNDEDFLLGKQTRVAEPKGVLNPRMKRILANKAKRDEVESKTKNASASSSTTNDENETKETAQEPQPKYVEICLSDIESVREAVQGGCDSIELCSNRIEGGITPSVGLVEEAVRLCKLSAVEVHVLVRPRPGLFTYTDSEFDTMVRDIMLISKLGITGFVIGILTSEGQIDMVRMKIIRSLTKNVLMTFHRAIDVCTEPLSICIDKLIELDCDRVLTSGRHSSAMAGAETLQNMVNELIEKQSDILVVAAAGVGSDNVANLITRSRVHGIHAGSSVTAPIRDTYNSEEYSSSSSSSNSNSNSNNGGNTNKNEINADGKSEKAPVSAFMGSSGNSSTSGVEEWSRVSRGLVAALSHNAKQAWADLTAIKGEQRGESDAAIYGGGKLDSDGYVQVEKENDLSASYVHVSGSKS
jgi:copper homeostasis protein